MAGKYKLDRANTGTDQWSRRAAHKTLRSALIDVGRDARRNATAPNNPALIDIFKPRYFHYRITLDGNVIFTVSDQDACSITGDEK